MRCRNLSSASGAVSQCTMWQSTNRASFWAANGKVTALAVTYAAARFAPVYIAAAKDADEVIDQLHEFTGYDSVNLVYPDIAEEYIMACRYTSARMSSRIQECLIPTEYLSAMSNMSRTERGLCW